MRRLALLMLIGCSDDVIELDASDSATDAAAIDPDAAQGDAAAVECVVGAAPLTAPVAGTYCAVWARIDGQTDAAARYFDRVDLTTTTARWWTAAGGGMKEYVTSAAGGPCLTVAGFNLNGGAMQSDPIVLCWSSANRACGGMTWKVPPLADSHWAVQLDACP